MGVLSRDSWTAYAVRAGVIDRASAVPARGNKYGAKRTIAGGRIFASKKEADYARFLELRQLAGEIADLRWQPKYPLHVMELWRSDAPIVIRYCGMYTADFEYVELRGPAKGEIVTVDVKSPATAKSEAYRLRKTLAEAIHGITIIEV
jgi:hypothetical protein